MEWVWRARVAGPLAAHALKVREYESEWRALELAKQGARPCKASSTAVTASVPRFRGS
jgi:hypothetical protein